MQVLHGEGVASHTGPESCAAVREDRGEALTGECVGQPLSGENQLRGADVAKNVSEVARGIDYRELTLANRSTTTLQSALRAKGIDRGIKDCIQEVIDQSSRLQAVRLRVDYEARLASIQARLMSARSVEEIGNILEEEASAAQKNEEIAFVPALEAGIQVYGAGRKKIYDPAFYQDDVARFGAAETERDSRNISLNVAKRDVSGAVGGGVVGFVAGPEDAFVGAVVGAVENSATAMIDGYAQVWFGID